MKKIIFMAILATTTLANAEYQPMPIQPINTAVMMPYEAFGGQNGAYAYQQRIQQIEQQNNFNQQMYQQQQMLRAIQELNNHQYPYGQMR